MIRSLDDLADHIVAFADGAERALASGAVDIARIQYWIASLQFGCASSPPTLDTIPVKIF